MLYREAGQFITDYRADKAIFRLKQERWVLYVVLAIAFLLVPYIGNDYWFSAILIPFLVLSLAGLGLNLLTGYAGQLSLGSAAFMAVGAFAAYNFHLRIEGLPFLISFLLGGFTAALVGILFGLPSLRIKGFYLLVSTLAAQFFVLWVFTNFSWFSNNNSSGVITAPQLIPKTKLLAFAISSFFLGIAGSLWAFTYLGTVEPHGFDLTRSFQILFIIIIGGMGSILGNFLGAAFIVLLPILLSNISAGLFAGAIDPGQLENFQKIIFGVLIIFFLIKEPNGLAKVWQTFKQRSRVWPLRF